MEALNFPGPYEMRIFYTWTGVEHVHRLNLDCDPAPSPGDPFSSINLLQRDTTAILADAWWTAYLAVIEDFFHTSTTFDTAELWFYPTLGQDAVFISSLTLGGTGQSVNNNVSSGELIQTFRTAEGGIMRVHFEECVQANNPSVGYAATPAYQQAFIDYVLSGDAVAIGRDTSPPIAFIKSHPGQSERIFKRRNRT